ncbi:hypothetical protein EMMF5_003988 [Cystobasidiomycetes sp. EMM_F5]
MNRLQDFANSSCTQSENRASSIKSAFLDALNGASSSHLPSPASSAHCRQTSPSNRAGSPFAFKKGFILDALPPIPAASLPELGQSHSSPFKSQRTSKCISSDTLASCSASPSLSKRSSDVASVDAKTARDDSGNMLIDHSTEKRRKLLNGGNTSGSPSPTKPVAAQRASSLLERIKAKEAAKSQTDGSGLTNAKDLLGPAASAKIAQRNAARHSLEVASARARHRESVRRT